MTQSTYIKRPLKIALLGYRSHPYVGGQGIYIKYLSQALSKLGHHVDVLSGPPYPELHPSVHLIKIPSLELFEQPSHIKALKWHHLTSFTDTFEWWAMATGGFAEPYTFGRRVVRHLSKKNNGYDVIHDNQSLSYGLIELQKKGFPILATVHHPITRDLQLALDSASSWGHRLLIKRWHSFLKMQTQVVQQLHHVITVSESSKRDIASEFHRPPSTIDVIHNGIDTELFKPIADVDRKPFRIITTSSSDQPLKGLHVLLKALKALTQSKNKSVQQSIHLVVIGTLKPDGKNQTLLNQLQLQERVTFKAGISNKELVNEYAKATVAVCPSLYEGFGLPAAEAMSCGTPLISSNGGALPEVVGNAGVVVNAGDDRALAQAIEALVCDSEKLDALSIAGRNHVKKHFCWNNVAQTLTDYYHTNIVQPEC